MKLRHLRLQGLGAMAVGFLLTASALLGTALAQAPAAKPNILFIMGDDIGWMQVGIYHRGLALGETPNIDRSQGPAGSDKRDGEAQQQQRDEIEFSDDQGFLRARIMVSSR
jgi:hypothetical protein